MTEQTLGGQVHGDVVYYQRCTDPECIYIRPDDEHAHLADLPRLWPEPDRSYRIRIEPHDGLWAKWYATLSHGPFDLSGGWYGRDRDKLERRVRRFIAKKQRKDQLRSQAQEILVNDVTN